MNNFTQIFQRIEKKYLLTEYQYFALRRFLDRTARVDRYGETSILNIYYDTPDFRLIRASIDGPAYKEKLRLRSYGVPTDESTAFLEIKKKYHGVVYKRRIDMPYRQAADYLAGGCCGSVTESGINSDMSDRPIQKAGDTEMRHIYREMAIKSVDSSRWDPKTGEDNAMDDKAVETKKTADRQISREIEWFFRVYQGLGPRMAISYDRIAMEGIKDPDFRVTFDRNITWRTDDLDLKAGNGGQQILQPGTYLMELKIRGAVEPALSYEMSRLGIFPVGFSKYGQGYLAMQREKTEGRKAVIYRKTAAAASFLQPAANMAFVTRL